MPRVGIAVEMNEGTRRVLAAVSEGEPMVLMLVLLIGLPLCLLLGTLPGPIVSRRTWARQPGSFRATVRIESGKVRGLRQGRRRKHYVAVWYHDVLIIRRGLIVVRFYPLAAREAAGVTGVAGDMVSMRLRLDEGGVIVVTAQRRAMSRMVGPFLMAELEHLAKAES